MENQEEKLQHEIMADAERKAGRLIDRATRDAETLLNATRRDNEKQRKTRLQVAQREADERARAIGASVEHDKRKRWLTRREHVIRSVFEQALAELESASELEHMQSELLIQAMKAVDSRQVTVKVAPGQRTLVEQVILPQVLKTTPVAEDDAAVEVEEDPAVKGGLVVVSNDGHRRFDNTFRAREERLRHALRNEILNILNSTDPQQDTQNKL